SIDASTRRRRGCAWRVEGRPRASDRADPGTPVEPELRDPDRVEDDGLVAQEVGRHQAPGAGRGADVPGAEGPSGRDDGTQVAPAREALRPGRVPDPQAVTRRRDRHDA